MRRASAAAAMLLALVPALAVAASPGETLTVSANRCIGAWMAPNPGPSTFLIANRAGRPGTVYLFHPVSGAIVTTTRIESSTTGRLTIVLHPGVYMWGCAVEGMPVRSSESATVPVDAIAGRPSGARIAPLTADQLAGPEREYRVYVDGRLRVLSGELRRLQGLLSRHRGHAARGVWLAAHVTWREVGGAYDAFGSLGSVIDGTPAGLPDGAASPRFTGFHRVEREIWDGRLDRALADTRPLRRAVARLRATFPQTPIAANELPLRTHEILEDSLRDELAATTGDVSGSSLAAVHGDIGATRELLALLAPLLAPRDPAVVARARDELRVADAELLRSRRAGRWVALGRLSARTREQIDGAIGATVETLAAVPALLAIGHT